MDRKKFFTAASWFVAVAIVVLGLLFLMSGLLEDHLVDLLVFIGMHFIISDLVKSYKKEKQKKYLGYIIFFFFVSLGYVVYFFSKSS